MRNESMKKKRFISFKTSGRENNKKSSFFTVNQKEKVENKQQTLQRRKSKSYIGSTKLGNLILNMDMSLNLMDEIDEPGNKPIKHEIERLFCLNREAKILDHEYERLQRSRSMDEKILISIKERELEMNNYLDYKYNYTSSFDGLKLIIEDYMNKLEKKTTLALRGVKTKTMINFKKPIHDYHLKITSKYDASLEGLYNSLGHEVYTKLIRVFEKYCLYGRTYTNFTMEYSQFSAFMSQNKIYDARTLTKTQVELIFNKIKIHNKSISFEEFILIIVELSKLVFSWERNHLKSFAYFVNKYIVYIQCLVQSNEEKNMERWYFFLENDDFQKQIKSYLPCLHKSFIKNKVKDLKQGECINTPNFLKMCKETKIIPVFLSSKEIISNINFIKYKKKSLVPTNNFDFCSFVEMICVIALQAFDKYMHEETRRNYLEHVEKLKKFMDYIKEKM